MNYRYDINGLRAIAVIGVVLFHFNSFWLTGGFAGVDVFFVISGFLMTGVIFKGMSDDSFNVWQFYMARANRIIPALAALCFVLFVFGWFYLTPVDNRLLGQHLASSMAFLSNFIYLRESGYFDPSSHGKWLLHTWSLSAEWQFYVIYPVVLVLLSKFLTLKRIKSVIVVSTIVGFILSVLVTYYKPSHSYFLLPTRAWEMLLGGVAFLYPLKIDESKKRVLEVLGVLLIIFSYVFITEKNAWPGYLTLIPVLGTFLIIQTNQSDSILTNNYVFQKIGSWSYSIYLWHWPLVVIGGYYSLGSHWPFLGMFLSVALGYLSFRFIESSRFKRKDGTFFSTIIHPPFLLSYVVISFGVFLYVSNGLLFKYPIAIQVASLEALNKNPRYKECLVSTGEVPGCIYGSGTIGMIVLGDSHAGSIVRSVESSKPSRLDKGVLDWSMSGCPTISGVYQNKIGLQDYSCGQFVNKAMVEFKDKYYGVPVVFINRAAAYIDGPNEAHLSTEIDKIKYQILDQKLVEVRGGEYQDMMLNGMFNTLCSIANTNPLYIVMPIPTMKVNVPKQMAREFVETNNDFRVVINRSYYEKRNMEVNRVYKRLSERCGATLIDVSSYFCDSDFCYGDTDGRPRYFDDNHLSKFGADMLIPEFERVWLNH